MEWTSPPTESGLKRPLYKMKADIGMLSKHRKCLEILPTRMVTKAMDCTAHIRNGDQIAAHSGAITARTNGYPVGAYLKFRFATACMWLCSSDSQL